MENVKKGVQTITYTETQLYSILQNILRALNTYHSQHHYYGQLNPTTLTIEENLSVTLKAKAYRPNPDIYELHYIAPEQSGRIPATIDHRADYYSTGILLYEMACGRHPFPAKEFNDIIYNHLTQPANVSSENWSNFSDKFKKIISLLLEKDPADRFRDSDSILHCISLDEHLLLDTPDTTLIALKSTDQIDIPKVFINRPTEKRRLLECFESALIGRKNILFLIGEEGVGKSSLVNHTQFTYNDQLAIKSDTYCRQNAQSLSAIYTHIQSVISQLLRHSGPKIEALVSDLNLLPLDQLITLIDTFPDLNILLDHDNSNIKTILSWDTLEQFLNVVSSHFPLVLHFENADQLDEASTQFLIQLLLKKPEVNILFILDCTGSGINDLTTEISVFKQQITNFQIGFRYITVKNLTQDQCISVVEKTFGSSTPHVVELGELLFQKTNGNPFFIEQMVSEFHAKNHIHYDRDSLKWFIDLEPIIAHPVSSNLVDVIETRFSQLPENDQKLIKWASVLKNNFSMDILSLESNTTIDSTQKMISKAISSGFLVQTNGNNPFDHLEFAHEKIQETIYASLMEPEKRHFHIKAAKFFLENPSPPHLFQAANHLMNCLIDDLRHHFNLLELYKLFFSQGKIALSGFNYTNAHAFFVKALEFYNCIESKTPGDSFEIYLNIGKCLYNGNHYSEADHFANKALEQAVSKEQRAKAYLVKIQCNNATNEYESLYKNGQKALQEFNFKIPGINSLIILHLIIELIKINFRTRNKKIEDYLELNIIEDSEKLLMIEVLEQLLIGLTGLKQTFFAYFCLRLTNMTLREGISSVSSLGFVTYAIYFVSVKQYKKAFFFADISKQFSKIHPKESLKSTLDFCHASLLGVWRSPLKESYTLLEKNFRTSLANNDVHVASSCIFLLIFNHFGKGDPLSSINEVSEHYSNFLNSNQTFKNDIVFYNAIINGIQKTTHPIPQLRRRKEINIFNEESSFQIRLIYLLIYLVIHNKVFLAEKVFRKLIPIMKTTKMGITHSDYLFYAGILNYKLYLKNKNRRYKSHLKKLHKELLLFASTMPENFSSKAMLLNACYNHINSSSKNPIRLFEKANREAKNNEFLQVQTFALEFIADIYASQQSLNVANIYYSQAIDVAKSWGSNVKVAQLESRISSLEKTAFLDASPVFETQDKQSQLFDLYSLVNFSQTISQEIEIENLLRKIVKITTENANAEKGAYIQVKNGTPYVLATYDTQQKEATLFLNSSKSDFQLPLSVINYTANTKTLTLSGSAQKDKFLQKDPVIINGNVKSVIAVPVKASGNMLGILYFENNHFENAFNKNHIQTLELLATQAAISLQNAYLYRENKDLIENLEHRVENQVNEIKIATEEKERSQIIAKKLAEQASHATLTRGIAHEIRNPLGLLLSGTEMILDSLDDPESIEEYCEVVKSSILRLRNITTTMLNYGSSTEVHHKAKTNINKLINDVKIVAIGECKKRRITMETTLDENIPEIVVNPNRINQAILNLVVNAIEAVNSNGNITLKTSQTQNTTLDNQVTMGIQIEVNDTGPGIDSENIEKIFDPFFTTKYENIGLGLSTVVNTLNDHNGRAWAYSDTVHGTSIFLWVPIRLGEI